MKAFKFSENDFSLNSIPTGFPELDILIGGWHRGNLIMIAAPFRMGKTAFALSMLSNNLIQENKSVIWFSTFLSKNQFTRMFVSNYTEIQIEDIIIRKIDQKLISEINEVFINHDFYFYDNPNLNVKKINQILAAFNIDNLPDYIIIDNLNYFEYKTTEKNKENEQTNKKLIELKAIARRFNIPVLVLYNCNFQVSKNSEFCTQFVKLKFNRYLTDTLCYIYRPEYYKIVESEIGESTLGKAFFIIAHNRGKTGSVLFKYFPQYLKFKECL